MKRRVLPLLLAALALLVFATAPVLAADKNADEGNTHTGKLVSVSGNKIVMSDQNGKNQHTHVLATDAKITCAGKACTLSDLKPGMRIRVTTSSSGGKKMVTRIDATGEGGVTEKAARDKS